MVRPADPIDGATPAGASLDRRGAAVGRTSGARRRPPSATRPPPATLRAATPILAKAPRSGGHWLAVAEAAVRGPLQIAVACDPRRLRAARRGAGAWRPAERSSSAVRSTRRSCCWARPDRRSRRRLRVPRARRATCPSRPPEELAAALGRVRVACRHGERRADHADRQPLPRARRGKGAADDVAALYARTPRSRIPSAVRSTSAAQAIRGFYCGAVRRRTGRDRGGHAARARATRRRSSGADDRLGEATAGCASRSSAS